MPESRKRNLSNDPVPPPRKKEPKDSRRAREARKQPATDKMQTIANKNFQPEPKMTMEDRDALL